MATKSFDLDGYLDAIRRKDIEGVLNMYADDVVITDVNSDAELRGKSALRTLMTNMKSALPDVDIDPVKVVRSNGSLAVLAHVRASYPKDFTAPGGATLAVGGKKLDTHAVFFVDVDDTGRIKHVHRFADLAAVSKQLGLDVEQLEEVRKQVMASVRPKAERPPPGEVMPPPAI
ncbi:MAG: nuclear transport factor 2 family protein [Myxococcota bacterium]